MSCAWCGGMGPESGVECEKCEGTHSRSDYIHIGASPYEEDCVQVGSNDYRNRASIEVTAYKDQLQRIWPDGDFEIKWSNHDYGSYPEVIAWMHEEDDVKTNTAFEAESTGPSHWDDEAKKYLESNNWPWEA